VSSDRKRKRELDNDDRDSYEFKKRKLSLSYQNDGPTIFKIIHINDVYLLDNLPSLATLVKREKESGDKVIVTLAGDFLAPSLLSSVDNGKGMIDTLVHAGVNLICFGNHEADIPHAALLERINEFRADDREWINSNMRKFEVKLPKYVIVDVPSNYNRNKRKVAFLGLLTNKPKVMKSSAFGGAAGDSSIYITDVKEQALKLNDICMSQADMVVPLTHQDLALDIDLAKTGVFGLILGGHEHTEHYIKEPHSVVIKTGQDALKAAVIKVRWENSLCKKAEISYEIVNLNNYPKDEAVAKVAAKHSQLVSGLEKAWLYDFRGKEVLSSRNARNSICTMGTFLCSSSRKSLNCDAVFINGGSIRGDKDYPHGKITLGDINVELNLPTELVVVDILGADVREIVNYSHKKDGVEHNYYLQADDSVSYNLLGEIDKINNEKIVDSKVYHVAFLSKMLFEKLDNLVPLLVWKDKNTDLLGGLQHQATDAKILVLKYLAQRMWKCLPSFDEIDTDRSGELTIDEVTVALKKNFIGKIASEEARNNVAKVLIDALDTDHDGKGKDGKISKQEYAVIEDLKIPMSPMQRMMKTGLITKSVSVGRRVSHM